MIALVYLIPFYNLKATSVLATVVVERKMIAEDTSYHAGITGEEAIKRLQVSGNPHCYLIRYSEAQECYILTVYCKQSPSDVEKHFKILVDPKYKIENTANEFESIGQLLEHYENHRIHPTLRKIGHKYTLRDYENHSKCSIL